MRGDGHSLVAMNKQGVKDKTTAPQELNAIGRRRKRQSNLKGRKRHSNSVNYRNSNILIIQKTVLDENLHDESSFFSIFNVA
jgi:hypothetical protein